MSEVQSNKKNTHKPRAKNRKPMWWRIVKPLIFIVVWILVIYAGMTVGYVVIGKQPIGEVFQFSTWKHVFDLIFAK
jgi:hypothetical protein